MLLATFTLATWALVAAPQADAASHDFEVLVVGALHAPFQFRHPDYTPAHVEAVLRAAEADVIGVESNPTWFARGEFYPVTYEAQGIAVPFAEERGIPVVGIDWTSIPSWDRMIAAQNDGRRADLEARAAAGPLTLDAFGRLPRTAAVEFDEYLRMPEMAFAAMNGLDRDLADSQWMPPGAPTDDGWGGERNRRIFETCLEAMADRPGERLVVVIGGGHKPVLDALFDATDGVRLLRLGVDVPAPTAEDLDAAWTAEHLAATLGHNLDGERTYLTPGLVDLERMARLADRLAEMPRQRPVASYFRARIAYEDGRFDDALALWDGLGEVFGQWDPYPFPMDHWRMRYGWPQTIRVERARTLFALDRDDEARASLDGLSERLPEVPVPVVLEGTKDALVHPGFDEGGFRSGATPGWYNDDVFSGDQTVALVDDAAEGERALRIQVERDRTVGLSSLSQKIALGDAVRDAGTFTFRIRSRARGIDALKLVAYRWRDAERRMESLASVTVPLDADEWADASLEVDVPDGVAEVHLFAYYAGKKGATIWFDDARTFEKKIVRTPEEWVPRTLAREFVRALQAGD